MHASKGLEFPILALAGVRQMPEADEGPPGRGDNLRNAGINTRSSTHLQQELLSGLPGDTPVALVQSASLPEQRMFVTRLHQLADTVARENVCSPAIMVIGNVAQAAALAGDAVQMPGMRATAA